MLFTSNSDTISRTWKKTLQIFFHIFTLNTKPIASLEVGAPFCLVNSPEFEGISLRNLTNVVLPSCFNSRSIGLPSEDLTMHPLPPKPIFTGFEKPKPAGEPTAPGKVTPNAQDEDNSGNLDLAQPRFVSYTPPGHRFSQATTAPPPPQGASEMQDTEMMDAEMKNEDMDLGSEMMDISPISSPSPSPAPLPNNQPIVSTSAADDTVIVAMIQGQHHQYQVQAAQLPNLGGWWSRQGADNTHGVYELDFGGTLPMLDGPRGDFDGALRTVLDIVHHRRPVGGAPDRVDVRTIWQLAQMQPTLGLAPRIVNRLGHYMGYFVADALRGPGLGFGDAVWEEALEACRVFRWADYYVDLAARLVFLCGTAPGPEGQPLLVRPDGGPLFSEICGEKILGKFCFHG